MSLTHLSTVEPVSEQNARRAPHWFRSVFFQCLVAGVCSFLAPGLFNAMTLTGAGGAQSPYLVNTANAILYAILTVTCVFGSVVTNTIGFRWTLVIGAMGYGRKFYAGGLYANKVNGTEWLVLFGAAMTGITGGIFWCVEGAIIIGYPEESKRGRYLGMWLGFRNFGTVVGSSINLGLNATTRTAGSLSSSTYIVFIVLQCLGPFCALLLSEPGKVIRPNGARVLMENKSSVLSELKATYHRVFKRWDVLLLVPVMLYVTWFSSYSGTFLALYFSVRSRALASFITSILSILANLILGVFLDMKRFSQTFKARSAFIAIAVLNVGMWVWQTIIQVNYLNSPPGTLDWAQGGTWYRGYGVYLLALTLYNINANYLYWVIATMATDPRDIVRLAGFLRGVEGAGGAGGFGMNTRKTLSKLVPLGFNFAFCVVSMLMAYPVIHLIGTPQANRAAPPPEVRDDEDVVASPVAASDGTAGEEKRV